MKPRSWLSRNQEPFWAVALFALWTGGYFLVGSFVDLEHVYSLATIADARIPFTPLAVFPYVALYLIFLLPFFLVRDREFFRVCAMSYITVMVFCYSLFWAFPVMMQRPEVQVTDFATWAVATIFANDVPANCFPSMHAAMSLMAALTIYHIDRRRGILALGVTLMIGISALLVKQHYIADILAGFAVALVSFYAYFKQRIQDSITRDLRKVPQVIEGYLDEVLERRLDPIIDRRVEEKMRTILAEYEKRRKTPSQD